MLPEFILTKLQLEGFTRASSKHVKGLNALDFTSIAWRIAKMDIKIDSSIMKEDLIVIAADSSGIKVAVSVYYYRKILRMRTPI